MKRVASTPSLQARASTPAPGSQGMRDMFFVRQDNINFNASYGTPVREVRPLANRRRRPNATSKKKKRRRLRSVVGRLSARKIFFAKKNVIVPFGALFD